LEKIGTSHGYRNAMDSDRKGNDTGSDELLIIEQYE
jgi:hypothetical protein